MDINTRLFIVIVFLLLIWAALNWLVNKLKRGDSEWLRKVLPEKIPFLEGMIQGPKSELYKIEVIQRKILPNTAELIIVDINGRHLLLSYSQTVVLHYLNDLNS